MNKKPGNKKVPLARGKAKKALASRRAFIRRWEKYRFANFEDCERLSLPPSFNGHLLKKDGTLCELSFGEPDKYRLPRRLRGKDFANAAKMIVDDWLDLPKDDQGYFALTFWRDLRLAGITFPGMLGDLNYFLRLGASEIFRAVADYIDALKSDRALAITTRCLDEYEFDLAASQRPPLTWREIQQRYWPDYKGSPQNFQKFLRQRRIDFKPVGHWRGRKCVQKAQQKYTFRQQNALARPR
jgi:hypothetical protein